MSRVISRLAAAVAVIAVTAGCATTQAGPVSDPAVGFPVTVTSCGRQVTYDKPPARAVAYDINMVEQMLALGLADRMVGTFGVDNADLIRPDLRADYDRVPHLAGDSIELEPLLGTRPDFLYAGWNYGLTEANNLTPDSLATHGVNVYELTESCAHIVKDKKAPSLEEVFTDLTNLGAIFGVPERAERIIDEQRARLAAVDQGVAGVNPVSVFVYDGGEEAPYTSPGLAIPNELIRRAGGANVFADIHKTWSEVSWEQVIARDPACVLIVDYDKPWGAKRDFMRQHPALRNITAVKNDCFLAQPYSAMTPGVRNTRAIQQIAGWLHPTRPIN